MLLNRVRFANLIQRAMAGVGNNKLLPITSLMLIKCADGVVTVCTTDGVNYLYCRDEFAGVGDFYAVVVADRFAKLLPLLDGETIELKVENNSLLIAGSGMYRLALPADERGEMVKYPDPLKSVGTVCEACDVPVAINKLILTAVVPSVSKQAEGTPYDGVYFGDYIIGTDTIQIAGIKFKTLKTPKLLNLSTVNLFKTLTDSAVVRVYDGAITIDDGKTIIYTNEMRGIEDYQIADIIDLLTTKYDQVYRVRNNELLRSLKRVGYFATAYEDCLVNLKFSNGIITIESAVGDGVDTVESHSYTFGAEEYECSVDVRMLLRHLKGCTGELIDISFGKSNAISLVTDDSIHVIALAE